MMSGSINRSTSARFTPRSITSPRISYFSAQRKWWVWPKTSFGRLAVIFVFVALGLVAGSVLYLYFFRNFSRGNLVEGFAGETGEAGVCNVFDGNWVRDDSYPLYNSSECPFVERGFNCLANGRKDTGYLHWRWKPQNCDVPKFSVHEVLEWLRGKRVVFVGDSMSRTQWESLICILMTGVEDPQTVYEVNGNNISKTIRFLGVKFETFNLTVEFYRSVFLVQQGSPPADVPRRVRMTLRLDQLDEINPQWVDSDLLIFNSGHWWTMNKLFDVGCYFQTDGMLRLGMSINSAFRAALETWATWVETTVNMNRTYVFFRTYEPSHWSGSNQRECEITEEPLLEAKADDRSEIADTIADVVSKMKVPVTVLNVTKMGAFRSDAHIGTWSHPATILDCSHWCLPGVPDAWNEIVFSYILN